MLEDVLTSDLGKSQELMRKPPRPTRRPDHDDGDDGSKQVGRPTPHSHPLDGQHGLGFMSRPAAHDADDDDDER